MNGSDILFGFLIAILLASVGCVTVALTRSHRETTRTQRNLFLTSFALRFAVSVLLYVGGLNESIVGAGDDSGWMGGVLIRSSWETAGLGPLGWPAALMGAYDGHHRGYAYLLAVYFSVIRITSQLSAAALGCFCGALIVVVTYRIARLLESEWVARRVGWWTCCFPMMIIWSCQSIKEPFVILFEAMALYACLCMRDRGFSIRHVLLAALSLAILPTLRFYAAYVTGGVVLLTLTLPQIRNRKMSIGSALVTAVLVIPLLSFTGALSRHAGEFNEWDMKRTIKFRQDIAANTGSGVELSHDMETNRGLSLAVLDGAAHMLLAPFPWELRLESLRMVLTMPEMVIWWILFFRAVLPGIMHAIRHRLGEFMPLLLFLAVLGLIYSLTFGNVGVIYRQRAQLLPYFLIFGASALERRRLRRPGTRPHDIASTAEFLAAVPPNRTLLESRPVGRRSSS